jgi:type II secretory pathway pseudopilin PulG
MNAGKASGFTLLGLLLVVGVMGAGLAAYGQIYSHQAQREKEAELLFVGNQFRQAIAAYYERTPGAVKRYPQKLEELLEDNRYPVAQRHLRRIYADPITGQREWGLMKAPEGGIMGVFSTSEAEPVKTGNFDLVNKHFADAKTYKDWQFFHSPSAPAQAR